MDKPGRNGLSNNEDIEDGYLAEEDILDVIDLEPNISQDVATEMEMLDMDAEKVDSENYDDLPMERESLQDDAKLVFSKHKGSVFSVALETSGEQLAVTGAEDDKAFLWRLATGEVILECTGHKDSVAYVCFSSGSNYVATGDLVGLIQVWDVKQLKLVWFFEVSDLEWLSWHPAVPVLMAGTHDGDMWMWKIPEGTTKTFQSFGHSCNIGKIMPDGKRCVAGYEDGSVRIWDLKAVLPLHTFSDHVAHKSLVTSISCHGDNSLILTGSTDGTALLFNTTSGKMLTRLQCRVDLPEDGMDPDDNSVETVGLSSVVPYAAVGTLSGHLMVWDIPTQICRQQCKHDSGIVKLVWHESQPLIYTCTLGGTVQLWDARTGSQERMWLGHEAAILDMHISEDGNTIVTTSDDQTTRVFTC